MDINWYKLSENLNKDFWNSLYWDTEGKHPLRKQCYWCWGYIKPDNEVVYPPGVNINASVLDRSNFEEMSALREIVDGKTPVEILQEGPSHVVCDQCKPFHKAWMNNI